MLLFYFASYAQNFEWAHNGKGTIETNSRIASDKSGNVYVCGSFQHLCIFTDALNSIASEDGFLVKFDSSGVEQWLVKIGGTSGNEYDFARDVAVDGAGNIYVTGSYQNDLVIGDTAFYGDGGYIAKFNSSGAAIWAHSLGDFTEGREIVCGDSQSVFIAGIANDSTDVPCASGVKGFFFTRFDSSGNCSWTQRANPEDVGGIAVDHDNNLYVTGYFIAETQFGAIVISPIGGQDVYLAKCSSQGNWQWAREFGGSMNEGGLSVNADADNNILVTGFFSSTVDFDCENLTSSGDAAIFISKTDSAGNCLWVQQAGGGTGNHYGFAVTTDLHSNCFISGSIVDTCNFGNITLVPGGERFYVAAYDKNGACQWAVETAGASGDRGVDLTTDGSGNVYAVGEFYDGGTHNFGNSSLQGDGFWIFVTKLSTIATEAIQNVNKNSIRIFPMPVTSSCIIEMLGNKIEGDQHFVVYDALSEQIKSEKLSGRNTVFEKGNLHPGIYFYHVVNEDGIIYRGKMIVD